MSSPVSSLVNSDWANDFTRKDNFNSSSSGNNLHCFYVVFGDHSYLRYCLVGFEKKATTWGLPVIPVTRQKRQKPVREVAHGGDQAESRPKNTFQKAGKGIERRTVSLFVLKNRKLGVEKDGNTLGNHATV